MTSVHASTIAAIAAALKKNKSFFIAGHVKPDGDTIGTGLALASLLKRMGKKASVYSRDPIPDNLLFMPGIEHITITQNVTKKFDCAVILECADFERMGNLIKPAQVATILNIDHHAHFNHYGNVNYIDPTASSSAEQVFNLFTHLKQLPTPAEATCLYVGLVTDTGKFQHSNTTPSALRMAACLLEAGVKPPIVYDQLYATQPLSALKLLSASLASLSLHADGRIATIAITHQTYRQTGSNATETEGIINYAMMVPGVQAAVMFRETDDAASVKVSLRSKGAFDVNKVANGFGGGGHKNAAGCSYRGTIDEARSALVEHIAKLL